jgi:hypothetical protein
LPGFSLLLCRGGAIRKPAGLSRGGPARFGALATLRTGLAAERKGHSFILTARVNSCPDTSTHHAKIARDGNPGLYGMWMRCCIGENKGRRRGRLRHMRLVKRTP